MLQTPNQNNKLNQQVTIVGKVLKKKKKMDRIQGSNSVPPQNSQQKQRNGDQPNEVAPQVGSQKVFK